MDHGLLSQAALLGVGGGHLLKGLLESLVSGLAAAVDLVSGHLSEVGASGDRVGELLDLLKVISHHRRVGT